MKQKKVLLTGATGFIGRYFIKKHRQTYHIKTFSFLKDNFNELDLKDVDVVIHLSALVHQMRGADIKDYEKVNVEQTLDLAKKAKESGVKQFVFMSSVKVYGEESDEVYTEKSICKPQDSYGESKLKAELGLKNMEDADFKVSIVRAPIVYGYGVKANMRSLVTLVKRFPILPFADINNRRSMVYVGNLSHLIDEIVKQEKNGIFLASDDEAISTTRLIELIAQSLGQKVNLVKIPIFSFLLKTLKRDYYKRLYGNLVVDNKETMKRLGLKNPFTTQEGIKLMIYGEKS